MSVGCASISFQVPKVTGSVLQAKTGLVAFSHFPPTVDFQQVIMAELIHAVVMPVEGVGVIGRNEWKT